MRRVVMLLVLLSLVGATIAVLPAGVASARNDAYRAVRKAMNGVPCTVAEVTDQESSENVKQLSHTPWGAGAQVGEVDVNGSTLAADFSFGNEEGALLMDISDPLRPRLLGRTDVGAGTADIKITHDGKTAVLGNYEGLTTAVVTLVDIRDRRKPKVMHRWDSPIPGALQMAHMVYTERIAERDWVFVAPEDSTGVWVLEIVGPPGRQELEFAGRTLAVEGGVLGPHDMYIQFDRELETWVLYAADGYHGWLAFDIADPTQPTLLGGFVHPSSGYTHTIQAGFVGGRRYVVTSEEVGVNYLKVYDASDLQAPRLVGLWNTGNLPASPAAQHNLQIVGDYAYVAHYGWGVYVFDISALNDLGPTEIARLEPVGHYTSRTSFWDVVLRDGVLYASGTSDGLHAIGFGCIRPGDPDLTSTG